VSATGYGEDLMRTVIAKTLADILDCKGGDARSAAKEALAYLKRKINGRGGFIVVDSQGNCASAFTTKRMIRGWIELGGRTICRF
jgi:beta-aspartyl-peptidase (threonine type)